VVVGTCHFDHTSSMKQLYLPFKSILPFKYDNQAYLYLHLSSTVCALPMLRSSLHCLSRFESEGILLEQKCLLPIVTS
jgi:hypothetical protein